MYVHRTYVALLNYFKLWRVLNIFCCIQPQYKESQVYLVRFKQYLSRALGLVKQHVVNSIKNTTRAVMPKQVNMISRKYSHWIMGILFICTGSSTGFQ